METEVSKHDVQAHEDTVKCPELPSILEEITVEEMAVDGICGIY